MLLDDYLKREGLPQYKFAEGLGIGPSALNRIIKGHNPPSWYEIQAIWEATEGEVGVDDWAEVYPVQIGMMLEVCTINRTSSRHG